MTRKDLKTMKKKVVTAFMMAALGSSLCIQPGSDGSRYYSKKQKLQKMRIRMPQ